MFARRNWEAAARLEIKTRTWETGRLCCRTWRKQVSLPPFPLPPLQASDSGSKRSLGHSLPGPDFRPHRLPPMGGCQAPSPPAPGQPAGRTQGGQHTLPTRPEINISQETELVLSVFTAKTRPGGGAGVGRAGGGGGGPLRNLVLGLTASTPTLPRTR